MHRASTRWCLRLVAALIIALAAVQLGVAHADPDAGAPAGGAAPVPPTPQQLDADAPLPPEVDATKRKARQIRALMAGDLDVAVEPQTLFAVPLDRQWAIAVELRRLQAIVAAADAATGAAGGGGAGGAAGQDAGGAGGSTDEAAGGGRSAVDEAYAAARLELDTKYEKAFQTDVSKRALSAFRRYGVLPPAAFERAQRSDTETGQSPVTLAS